MFQPALTEKAAASIERTTGWSNSQWGLGLCLDRDDCPGRRRKGSGFCTFGCSLCSKKSDFMLKWTCLQGMVGQGRISLLIQHLGLLQSVTHRFYPLLILRYSKYGRRRKKLYMHSDIGVYIRIYLEYCLSSRLSLPGNILMYLSLAPRTDSLVLIIV